MVITHVQPASANDTISCVASGIRFQLILFSTDLNHTEGHEWTESVPKHAEAITALVNNNQRYQRNNKLRAQV